ncbi:MAG: MBL fold metallo-hydrolase, partial [Actinomycetota bacterium]|nr:MBL fold metallo-hydrolase [Actinomycetota bacterium]
GPLDNNAYLIRSDQSGNAVLVDAAAGFDSLSALVEGSSLSAIITTHGHWDHHQAAREMAEAFAVPALLDPADSAIADGWFGSDIKIGRFLIGDVEAHILHTPGHTPGSVSILLDGVVLTGDTLFPGGPGATRFDHSSFARIIESISTQLFTLGDETVVLPGHGDATTIGTERGHLQSWVDRGW